MVALFTLRSGSNNGLLAVLWQPLDQHTSLLKPQLDIIPSVVRLTVSGLIRPDGDLQLKRNSLQEVLRVKTSCDEFLSSWKPTQAMPVSLWFVFFR